MYEWEDKRTTHPTASNYGSLSIRTTIYVINQVSSKTFTQNMRHIRGDICHAITWYCGDKSLRTDLLHLFCLEWEGGGRNLWFEGNSATKGRGRKLNSAKCTCEKRIRPMYMHNNWFMQFHHKRWKFVQIICAHFLHCYIVKASHVFSLWHD